MGKDLCGRRMWAMRLENIIGLKEECAAILEPFKREFDILEVNTKQELEERLKEEDIKSKTLLIAATDETIAIGKKHEIATMAYANPKIMNQTYAGVEMLVEGFEEVDEDFLEKVYQRWHHIPWKILETDRCMVREITLEDIDGLFSLYEDEGMDAYTEPLYSYEEEMEYQRAYINHMYRYFGYGMWLVFLKENGKLIGRAGLEHREIQEQTELEIGYLIGKSYQGNGYATEVCKAIINYAKEHTGFERINCIVEDGNDVSMHLAMKLGFEEWESYEIERKIMHRFVRELS